MDELRTRVRRSLDACNAPELGEEIERRVDAPVPPRAVRNEFAGPHDAARRVTAAVTALVVFAAAGVFVWNAFRPGTTPAHATAGPGTFVDPLGWRLGYPAGWLATPFYDDSAVLVSYEGAMFSNATVRAAPSTAATPNPGPFQDPAQLPADGVVLTVSQLAGGPSPDYTRDDSSLPLSIHDLRPVPGPSHARQLYIRGDGIDYTVKLLVGPDARQSDLQTAAMMIASIRFPSLKQGQEMNHWMSLGRADRYQMSRGTPAHVPGPLSNVYVMRAPGGDYVLDLDPDSCGNGAHETWDARTLQILIRCPDGSVLRYSRNGTPVDANPAAFQKRLNLYPVITSWNGMLLVAVDTTTRGTSATDWG